MEINPAPDVARKRRRLTHACERCRSRKVRCDELEPDCSNCVRAGLRCHTFDPRQPHVAVQRREARGLPATSPQQPSSAGSTPLDQAHVAPKIQQDTQADRGDGLENREGPQRSQLLPMLPRFVDGNSLFMLMQWLDLAFTRLGVKHNLSSRYGSVQRRRTRETQRHRLATHTDVLPPTILDEHVAIWFDASIGQILPICNAAWLWKRQSSTIDPIDEDHTMKRLVVVLIVACAAAKDKPDMAPGLATRCFDYALSRLADIIGEGQSIHSLQALALMILLLRWQNEVEMAWHLLSLAVSILYRQGLHKHPSISEAAKVGDSTTESNLYWSLYILDKVLALELERQPLLRNADCNRSAPQLAAGGQNGAFVAMIQLSQLQDSLLERLKMSRKAEEAASTYTELQQLVKRKMETVGDLDQQLQAWVDGLPQEQKPSEYQYADGTALTGTSFLAAQYHQTLFIIHRHALVHNAHFIRAQVDEFFPDKPYRNRLRNGQTVCANAARALLSVIEHLNNMDSHCPLINTYTPMLAICTLTIYIIRRQSPASAKADLELQSTAIALVVKQTHERYNQEEHPEAHGDDDLISLLTTLHDFTASYIHRSQPQSPRRSATSNSDSTTAPANAVTSIAGTSNIPNGPFESPNSAQPGSSAFYASSESQPISGTMPIDPNEWPLINQLDTDMEMLWGPNAMDLDWDSLALAYDLPSG